MGLILIEGVTSDGKPYQMSIFDAFYFISYTATTIGFGETPYAFNYEQRIWVSMLIYFTVTGWFYSIGTLVSLVQDKMLIKELAKNRFIKQVKALNEDFFIILGYNATTKKIIEKSLHKGFRVVVIEKNDEKVSELRMEGYTPAVPVLQADITSLSTMELSGIKSRYCKGLVALFKDDSLNLHVAIMAKFINSKVPLAIKSTTENLTENLMDVGVEIIENPFNIISNQIDLSLNSPSTYQLAKWIFNLDTLKQQPLKLSRGKYIVCGYGRMGKEIHKVLQKNQIDARFIEVDPKKVSKFNRKGIVIADADDKDILIEQGIYEASVIIAGTNNDITNLSLLSTAKKLNPNIITVARENELENYSIFRHSHIDYIFMPSRILIHKTINALVNPLSDKFFYLLKSQIEEFSANLITKLLETIGEKPVMYELAVNQEEAYALSLALDESQVILLKHLTLKRDNRDQQNAIVPLLLQRGKKLHFMPPLDIKLQRHDKILFAATDEAIEDTEYIAQNSNELIYVTNDFEACV